MALALAERGLGNVWPNPAVGCVLVKDGRVVGRGWTQPGGRPHAESEAIDRAGAAARGSTAYVTLEPCAHHGRTPPCVDLMLSAGIARAVVAAVDPDPRVDGKGIARLRAGRDGGRGRLPGGRGLPAQQRLLPPDAAPAAVRGSEARDQRRRPIATAAGDSQWITGAEARAEGHRLRLRHDAILVGSGTALADDPILTCRLPGWSTARPSGWSWTGACGCRRTAGWRGARPSQPLWLFTPRRDGRTARALRAGGVTLFSLHPHGFRPPSCIDMLWRPSPSRVSRACWSRAAPRWPPPSFAAAWSTASISSTRRC